MKGFARPNAVRPYNGPRIPSPESLISSPESLIPNPQSLEPSTQSRLQTRVVLPVPGDCEAVVIDVTLT